MWAYRSATSRAAEPVKDAGAVPTAGDQVGLPQCLQCGGGQGDEYPSSHMMKRTSWLMAWGMRLELVVAAPFQVVSFNHNGACGSAIGQALRLRSCVHQDGAASHRGVSLRRIQSLNAGLGAGGEFVDVHRIPDLPPSPRRRKKPVRIGARTPSGTPCHAPVRLRWELWGSHAATVAAMPVRSSGLPWLSSTSVGIVTEARSCRVVASLITES